MRNVANEKNQVTIGKTGAKSTKKALLFHLIAPTTVRRLAERLTVGAAKYGVVQWRIGLNDVEYVADRYNHLWAHLLLLQEGDTEDDHLGAMLWAINALMEAERLCPEAYKKVLGTCQLFGEAARAYNQEVMEGRD